MDGSMFPAGFGGPMDRGDAGSDAWIESLLREDAARQPHIADDGFAFRVMMNMPAPRKLAPKWIVPMAAIVGSAAAVGLTPAGAFIVDNLLHLLDFRNFSPVQMMVLVPVVLAYACSFSALRER